MVMLPATAAARHTLKIDLDGDPLVADVYTATTPNDAPPVLLVHGWGGSGRYWYKTVAQLRDQFTLIVPDMPGVGRAMPVHTPRDMFAQVGVLEMLLVRLNVERVHVVGHSMGAGLTMLLAAQRPDLVERLVLTSIALFTNDAQRAFFERVIDSADVMMRMRGAWMADVPGLVRQAAKPFFTRIPDEPDLLRAAFRDYLAMDRATAIASARSAVSPKIQAAAAQIQAPTLLVVCRDDRYMPQENVAATVRMIPHCETHWIEDCGHLPMVERPDEYAALLRAFLTS